MRVVRHRVAVAAPPAAVMLAHPKAAAVRHIVLNTIFLPTRHKNWSAKLPGPANHGTSLSR